MAKALEESAATASTKPLRVFSLDCSLKKCSATLRSMARAATIVGWRLRVLSSKRQASLRQWLRISMPPQWSRMRRSHFPGERASMGRELT